MRASDPGLIERHRSYAKALVADILRRLPPQADRQELEAAADLGLVEAAAAYNPSRGVQFKTFAYYRIRGAIYDAIRKATWMPKSEYDKLRAEAAANQYMADYAVGDAETAGSGAQGYAETARIAGTLAAAYWLSLEAENVAAPVDPTPDAEQLLLEGERGRLVRQALEKLPEKNRSIVEDYYFRGLTLEEAGAKLGLSKSWTSRVHAKSLEMLRAELERSLGTASESKRATSGVRRR